MSRPGGGIVEADPMSTAPSFEEFVAARGRALWRSAWLLTGDAHLAEDLVQTALVKVWRRWDSVSGAPGSLDAYVRRALVTTYTDWWRRRWTAEVPTGRLPDDTASERDLTLERRDVLAALALLPRGQRAVIVLRFFDDPDRGPDRCRPRDLDRDGHEPGRASVAHPPRQPDLGGETRDERRRAARPVGAGGPRAACRAGDGIPGARSRAPIAAAEDHRDRRRCRDRRGDRGGGADLAGG